MLSTLNEDTADPYTQFFMAKVVDNQDPDKKQRIKVSIPKVLTGPKEDLPWLLPIHKPSFGGISKDYGVMNVPPIGSNVIVTFQGGDLNYGLLMGTTTQHDQNLEVLQVNYPKRYGFVDPAGNHFFVDTTENSVDVEFKHKSGTMIHIDDKGNVDGHVVASITLLVDKDVDINVKGNVTTNVDGNVTSTVKGNVDQTVNGNVTQQVDGNVQATIQGDVSETVSGSLDLTVSSKITSTAASWSHSGDITVNGLVTASTDVVGGGISLKGHKHIGVSAGKSKTGIPFK